MRVPLLFTLFAAVSSKMLQESDDHVENTVIEVDSELNTYSNLADLKNKEYKPEWTDLDTRPLPEWYDKAKIGIFLHWGVFSVPSFHSEWFWSAWKDKQFLSDDVQEFMSKNYPPGFSYQEFAPMFTAEFFDPAEWANLFARAGAKYVVLTSKHHEGFTLFPSKRSFGWNAVDVGPHRDLVGDLAAAVKNASLEFGLYHSLYEWFNPIFLEDSRNKFNTYEYRTNKLWPDFKQLVTDYKPSIIWSDGDWVAPDTYWNSTLLLAWLYNESPVKDHVVVNDRWGIGTPCHHGDFYNCQDKYNPGTVQPHKWENAFTLDARSWGYRRNMNIEDVMSMKTLLKTIIMTVSCGGNALINVGPTKEGIIAPIFQERLLALGKWLDLNGEAIYDSSPWLYQNDTLNGAAWYTCTKTMYNAFNPTGVPEDSDMVTAIYVLFLKWPVNGVLALKDITSALHSGIYQIQMLGQDSSPLDWKITNGQVNIQLPDKAVVNSEYAWALKFAPK